MSQPACAEPLLSTKAHTLIFYHKGMEAESVGSGKPELTEPGSLWSALLHIQPINANLIQQELLVSTCILYFREDPVTQLSHNSSLLVQSACCSESSQSTEPVEP